MELCSSQAELTLPEEIDMDGCALVNAWRAPQFLAKQTRSTGWWHGYQRVFTRWSSRVRCGALGKHVSKHPRLRSRCNGGGGVVSWNAIFRYRSVLWGGAFGDPARQNTLEAQAFRISSQQQGWPANPQ